MTDRLAAITQDLDMDWAQDQFREVPDGQYGFWELGDVSNEVYRAAIMFVCQWKLDQQSKPQPRPMVVFRGEKGEQILDSRTSIPKTVERIPDFIFIVQDGAVVEFGEDMTGKS